MPTGFLLVVKEIEFGQFHQSGLSIAHFEFQFSATADNLLRWNAVDCFRPRAHELDSAAGDDERS